MVRNFLWPMSYSQTMKTNNPPLSPFRKGGRISPPFKKGRLGGIL